MTTSQHRSDFLVNAESRGFMHQCTDLEGLDDILRTKAPVKGYIGFDCTADSLHVGSLVPIMLLRWFQKTGNKPIVLLGGGTSKVGDPSGKEETRQLLSKKEIKKNLKGIRTVFEKFLTFGKGPTDAVFIDNDAWLDGLHYIDFLREYGSHFSVNRMLSFDSVKLRLEREHPLSFLEFNYMILQAYDFLELARRHDCQLQMGGSDQWGNIVNGIELGRRIEGRELFGFTSPLITTSSGAKMGKTVKGSVWLDAKKLSPYDYWQYWRNTEDGDVGRFLRLFTDLSIEEIARLESLEGSELNAAKKVLADAATAFCHGEKEAGMAAKTAHETFEAGVVAEGLPTIQLPRAELEAGILAFELFCRAGLATSNAEARRLIRGGGARVNGTIPAEETTPISTNDLDADGVIKLSAGKKRHALIRVG